LLRDLWHAGGPLTFFLVRRNIEQRWLNHCRQLYIQRCFDSARRAQSSETLYRRHGKTFVVIVEVDVLRYPVPLNNLANINPRPHARGSVFDNLIPDRRLGLNRLAIAE
jgi:hypothetical protein